MIKIILNIIAMILLVLPSQHLIRGVISKFIGENFSFSILGLSEFWVIIISIILLLISLFLFNKAKTINSNKL